MSARFMIEVPHDGTMAACLHAIEIFHETGSHFLTHADWGCKDGVHKAWIVVDVENREEARAIVPPAYRQHATIVQLNEFSEQDIEFLRRHVAG